MEFSPKEAQSIIRAAGMRATLPRIHVLRILSEAIRPLSHSEVVARLEGIGGDQATAYRSLVSFQEKGIVRVASHARGIARYELVGEGEEAHHVHPHFICNECGMVSCLPKTTYITAVDEQWRECLKMAAMQFVGKCQECA